MSLFRRAIVTYLRVACWILSFGAFAAFARTARLVWEWRASWNRVATIGALIAALCFALGATFLWLAIYEPWRARLNAWAERE
jgi:hypothetical protein